MKNVVYFNSLFDIYKDLLTDKEQEVFKLYYADDYSLQEIAEYKNVSRSAVFKMIKVVEEKLENMEQILKIYMTKNEVKKILDLYKDEESTKKIAKILEIEL